MATDFDEELSAQRNDFMRMIALGLSDSVAVNLDQVVTGDLSIPSYVKAFLKKHPNLLIDMFSGLTTDQKDTIPGDVKLGWTVDRLIEMALFHRMSAFCENDWDVLSKNAPEFLIELLTAQNTLDYLSPFVGMSELEPLYDHLLDSKTIFPNVGNEDIIRKLKHAFGYIDQDDYILCEAPWDKLLRNHAHLRNFKYWIHATFILFRMNPQDYNNTSCILPVKMKRDISWFLDLRKDSDVSQADVLDFLRHIADYNDGEVPDGRLLMILNQPYRVLTDVLSYDNKATAQDQKEAAQTDYVAAMEALDVGFDAQAYREGKLSSSDYVYPVIAKLVRESHPNLQNVASVLSNGIPDEIPESEMDLATGSLGDSILSSLVAFKLKRDHNYGKEEAVQFISSTSHVLLDPDTNTSPWSGLCYVHRKIRDLMALDRIVQDPEKLVILQRFYNAWDALRITMPSDRPSWVEVFVRRAECVTELRSFLFSVLELFSISDEQTFLSTLRHTPDKFYKELETFEDIVVNRKDPSMLYDFCEESSLISAAVTLPDEVRNVWFGPFTTIPQES